MKKIQDGKYKVTEMIHTYICGLGSLKMGLNTVFEVRGGTAYCNGDIVPIRFFEASEGHFVRIGGKHENEK